MRRPPQRLFLHHHSFADDPVDGGLGDAAGDRLTDAVAHPLVGDDGPVGPQVAAELGENPGLLHF